MAPWFVKFAITKIVLHLITAHFAKKNRTCKNMGSPSA